MWKKNALFAGLVIGGVAALVALLVDPPAARSREQAPPADAELVDLVAAVDTSFRNAWYRAGVAPASPADDLTVARRMSLALAGTIPSLEEIREFEARGEDRLNWWLERLLSDRRHADYLAERFARAFVGTEDGPFLLFRRRKFVAWLSDQIYENRPYGNLVAGMISGTGLWTDRPQTNFITVNIVPNDDRNKPDANKLAARVSRTFLGIRLDCAQCHDHPFNDDYRQSDFQQLAAFFGQAEASLVGVRDTDELYKVEAPDSPEAQSARADALAILGDEALDLPEDSKLPPARTKLHVVRAAMRSVDKNRNHRIDRKEVRFAHLARHARLDTDGDGSIGEVELIDVIDGLRPVSPAVPFQDDLVPLHGSARERLAAWITDEENELFARATVNRVWNMLLGRPLVAPVDDMPRSGPFPPALELLAQDFALHNYDLRRLIRTITSTEVFRMASAHPADGDTALSQAGDAAWHVFPLTRLRPEQVVGGLLQSASLSTIDYDSHILIRIARQEGQDNFLRRYGDAGEAELESAAGTIPQRLLLLNGNLVQSRVDDNLFANAATRIAVFAPDAEKAIEMTYLTVLTRRPTPSEADYFARRFTKDDSRDIKAKVGDLYWTLLNATEFSWNH